MNRIENHRDQAQGHGGSRPSAALKPVEDAPRLPRKERETRRHRRELLEAAERLLASKRFHEITVQDISAESEFSVGYIYKLFAQKDEILAALIGRKLRELRSLLDESLETEDTWEERALTMLEAMFMWLDETPAYRSGVIPDLSLFARNNPGVASDLAAFRRDFRRRIRKVFNEPLRLGLLVESKAGTITRTFEALVSGFTDDGLHEDPRGENLRAYAPLVVYIIRRTFSPEGGDR